MPPPPPYWRDVIYEQPLIKFQGLSLGPILYAIYVAPLFDFSDLFNFADDHFSLSAINLLSKFELILQNFLASK